MNCIAKEEIESGNCIDGVEDKGAFVEQQLAGRVGMRSRDKPDQIVVYYVAEQEVKSDAKDPSKQNLIISVDAMVYPAEGNHEDR